MTSSVEAINGVVKTYSGLAGLIFLLLIIAQFIAFFNYTNIADGARGRTWPTGWRRRARRRAAASSGSCW